MREKVPVKIIEQTYEYRITELKPGEYSLFDVSTGFDFEKYHRTKSTHSLSNIDSASIRKEVDSSDERTFTEYSLVAELSLYLTQHEMDSEGKEKVCRWSPVKIRELLEHCTDGIEAILEKVNYSNSILYDWIVPELFKQIYKISYEKGEKKEIIKWLTKDPPKNPDGTDGCYNLNFDDDSFVEETVPQFSEYSQSDFYVHYIDPELHTLRSYYPDFLVELNDGKFYIVEIKGENLIDKASTQAKVQYAKQMYSASGLEYVFIPSKYADMILQEFIADSENLNLFEETETAGYETSSDYGLLKVASPN